MKAFEEWDKKQPVVNIPEPFATFVTQERERTWKAALGWTLKRMKFEKGIQRNENININIIAAFYATMEDIKKELEE